MIIVWEGEPRRLGPTLKMWVRWQVAMKCWIPGFLVRQKNSSCAACVISFCICWRLSSQSPQSMTAKEQNVHIFIISVFFLLILMNSGGGENKNKKKKKKNSRSYTKVGVGKRKCLIPPPPPKKKCAFASLAESCVKDPSKNNSAFALPICSGFFLIQLPGRCIVVIRRKKMCFFFPFHVICNKTTLWSFNELSQLRKIQTIFIISECLQFIPFLWKEDMQQ